MPCKLQHHEYRDCQAWRDVDLPLTTTSNEAAKLFDASVSQYVGFYSDTCLGGIGQSLEDLKAADPDFVLGQVLAVEFEMLGGTRSTYIHPELHAKVDSIVKLADSQKLTKREEKHVTVMQKWAKDDLLGASALLEEILLDHPTDPFALRLAQDCNFYLGEHTKMRDTVVRVLPAWKPSMPLYSYIYGMYAFGLVETFQYEKAEMYSKKALELNPYDGWSSHTLLHVYEMNGRLDEGLEFIEKTCENWMEASMIACHNFWHWGVFQVEKGDLGAALGLFDNQVGPRSAKSGSMFGINDAASLLQRVEMEGGKVGNRWQELYERGLPAIDNHHLVFDDAHCMMAFLGSGHPEVGEKFMESVREFLRSEREGSSNKKVFEEVGVPLMEGLMAYHQGNYAETVAHLQPIRYHLRQIGGSNAQRDIFSLVLTNAAMKSPDKLHNKLARSLLYERQAEKGSSPLADRMMMRLTAEHLS